MLGAKVNQFWASVNQILLTSEKNEMIQCVMEEEDCMGEKQRVCQEKQDKT